MQYLKKHWYLVIIALLTIGLAVVVIVTSGKLSQTKEVAPTVPQEEPEAAVVACTLAFNINVTETLTPTPTPTPTPTLTNTPTSTPTPVPTSTPTPTPEQIVYNTPTPTPEPPPAACNTSCTLNTDCTNGLVCIGGACRNPSCTSQADCVCVVAQAQPTPKVPVSGSGTSVLGASIIAGGLLILLLGFAL